MKTSEAEKNNYVCPKCGSRLARDHSGKGYVHHLSNFNCSYGKGERDRPTISTQLIKESVPVSFRSVPAPIGERLKVCSACQKQFPKNTNYCTKCGSPLIDADAETIPMTQPLGQDVPDEVDILIEIKAALRKQSASCFIIVYADVDKEHNLPPGSTSMYIDRAAEELNMEITKGSTRAELRRK